MSLALKRNEIEMINLDHDTFAESIKIYDLNF